MVREFDRVPALAADEQLAKCTEIKRHPYFASGQLHQNVACSPQTKHERKMTMEQSTIWWVLAGVMVAVELATGTFYLLMLATGMAAGAIAAHLGMTVVGQIVAAAVIGGGAVVLQYWRGRNQPKAATANANKDVHIDIGEMVSVVGWAPDGTTTVKYRGASWTAVMANPAEPADSGQFRIMQLLGNRLVLEKA